MLLLFCTVFESSFLHATSSSLVLLLSVIVKKKRGGEFFFFFYILLRMSEQNEWSVKGTFPRSLASFEILIHPMRPGNTMWGLGRHILDWFWLCFLIYNMADTYPISGKNLHSCNNNPIKIFSHFRRALGVAGWLYVALTRAA